MRFLISLLLILCVGISSAQAERCDAESLARLGINNVQANALGCDGLVGDVDITGTLTTSSNATVGGTLGVTGATTLSSTLSAGASTLASVGVTGAATVGTTLGVTGATTLTSTLDANGAVTAAGITIDDAATLKLDVGTIAAAGSDATDGTAVVDQISYVTASDGTKGVELPSGTIGEIYVIHNTVAANNLLVYPPDSGAINGGTATTGSVVVAGEETGLFIKVAADTWYGGVLADF